MSNPFFSIIIPTLNEEKYLPKLLADLTKQSFKEFEVIVVDGNSDDKTKSKTLEFSTRLNLQFFEVSKRNVSYQRNFGAEKATTNFLIFLDADARIPVNFLKKINQAIAAKKPDLLTTYIKTDEKGLKPIETGSNLIFEVSKLIGYPALYGSMLLVKKSVFNAVGGFDEDLKYKEDTKLSQEIFKKGYSYEILRDTYYYWSLRRFRKQGNLKTLQKYVLLNLNKTLDYPMGGRIPIERRLKFKRFVENLIEKYKLQ